MSLFNQFSTRSVNSVTTDSSALGNMPLEYTDWLTIMPGMPSKTVHADNIRQCTYVVANIYFPFRLWLAKSLILYI